MDWNKIRKDFPVTENAVYFQSAGMSPMPTIVMECIQAEYKKLNQFGDIHWQKDLEKVNAFKKHLATLINADVQDVSFVSNNSLAMSLVALSFNKGISGKFNIISMEEEFPSNSVPYEYQNITVKYVKHINHRYHIDDILKEIDMNTKAVVTSYVQFATGFRQDLVKLGAALKKLNILHIVNATQGFPIFSIDVQQMNIDVLTCSLHKWGFAGHIGTMFYTSDAFRKRFPSPIAGWLSVKPSDGNFIHNGKNVPFEVYDSADQYSFGTSNLQTMLAAKTAFEYLENIGFENIRNRIAQLYNYLLERIKPFDVITISPVTNTREQSAILSISLNAKSNEDCLKYLENQNIFTSIRNEHIRIALNIFNNEEDLDKLADSLKFFLIK